jgi:hypothetical protein
MELIYKDALLKELGITNEDCEKCAWGNDYGHGYCTRGSDFTDACDAICTAPVIEERKTGKWEIYVISMIDGEGCRCSECGFEGAPYWDFCPNCGADMREQP